MRPRSPAGPLTRPNIRIARDRRPVLHGVGTRSRRSTALHRSSATAPDRHHPGGMSSNPDDRFLALLGRSGRGWLPDDPEDPAPVTTVHRVSAGPGRLRSTFPFPFDDGGEGGPAGVSEGEASDEGSSSTPDDRSVVDISTLRAALGGGAAHGDRRQFDDRRLSDGRRSDEDGPEASQGPDLAGFSFPDQDGIGARPVPRTTLVYLAAGIVLVLAVVFVVLDPLGSTPGMRGGTEAEGTPGGAEAAHGTAGAAGLESGTTSAPGGPGASNDGTAADTPTAGPVVVHVVGAVEEPGVVELPPGARVSEAVAGAGGTAEGADTAALNLARVLTDGEQVYVPREGEEPAVGAGTSGGGGVAAGGATGSTGDAPPVDLNTADLAALESLPGIGPVTAAAILAHREENGPFTSVDGLLDVSGIGEKTLENLRDRATV